MIRNKVYQFLQIFKSPALSLVMRWTGYIKGKLTLICLGTIVSVLCSLGTSVVTKGLIDSAIGHLATETRNYGIMLVVLMAVDRLVRIGSASLRVGTNARIQRKMQG